MPYHLAEEGCEVDVMFVEPDVITISCVNSGIESGVPRSDDAHRYHCTNRNGVFMVFENTIFGTKHVHRGARAKQLLVDDEVWLELPTYFRNSLKFA